MNINKKKIMIYAYTKFNLGDDLLIKLLCDRYPDWEFRIYTYSEYKKALSNCLNLKVYSNGSWRAKIINRLSHMIGKINAYERNIAKKCDACVCISGSLFIQGGECWEPYLDYMKTRKINEIPYFQIGSNFGPYTDEKFLQGFKKLFSVYDDICFREQYSANMFSELNNVRVAPDVVFSGNYCKYIRNDEKRVAVSVIDLSNRPKLKAYKFQYLNFIEDICKKYLELEYQVDLLSFCQLEGDEEPVFELKNRLNCSRVKTHCYHTDTNLEEMLYCIGRAEIVIATRFHAMILGWCMEKIVLPIIYSPKMEHVIEEINYNGVVFHIGDKDNNAKTILKRLNALNKLNTFEICKKSEEQFLGLDKLNI